MTQTIGDRWCRITAYESGTNGQVEFIDQIGPKKGVIEGWTAFCHEPLGPVMGSKPSESSGKVNFGCGRNPDLMGQASETFQVNG